MPACQKCGGVRFLCGCHPERKSMEKEVRKPLLYIATPGNALPVVYLPEKGGIMSKNHNLELTIDKNGVMHLNHWDSNHGVDRIFQIRPDEQNAGKWVSYEEIYNPDDYNEYVDAEPDLISVDLLAELAKMATAWRERAAVDIAEENEKNREWHAKQLNETCQKCEEESCHGCETWKDGIDILIKDVSDERKNHVKSS